MLDERLSMAYSFYVECDLAADIGTDHGFLPAALLASGRCRRMILTDLSASALENARKEMIRRGLLSRVSLRLGDGLAPLSEPCGVISVMGMGGRTIRDILLSGASRLAGASLILSAHTDLPLIRQAVRDVHYTLDREEPVLAGGRYYLVLRARPGDWEADARTLRLGGPLFRSGSPLLRPYLARRREILQERLRGLRSAREPNQELIAETLEDIHYYTQFLEDAYDCSRSDAAD